MYKSEITRSEFTSPNLSKDLDQSNQEYTRRHRDGWAMCFGTKAPPSPELQFIEHLKEREESGPNGTAQNCTGGGGGCLPQRVERLAKGRTVMRNFASVVNVDKRVERLAKGMAAIRGFFPVMNGDKRKGDG